MARREIDAGMGDRRWRLGQEESHRGRSSSEGEHPQQGRWVVIGLEHFSHSEAGGVTWLTVLGSWSDGRFDGESVLDPRGGHKSAVGRASG